MWQQTKSLNLQEQDTWLNKNNIEPFIQRAIQVNKFLLTSHRQPYHEIHIDNSWILDFGGVLEKKMDLGSNWFNSNRKRIGQASFVSVVCSWSYQHALGLLASIFD
jgi:hypothetical protein